MNIFQPEWRVPQTYLFANSTANFFLRLKGESAKTRYVFIKFFLDETQDYVSLELQIEILDQYQNGFAIF